MSFSLSAVTQGLALQATTPVTGFALVNGTPNVVPPWTPPNDGRMHRYIIFAQEIVTITLVGGEIAIQFTDLGGTVDTEQFSAAALTPGLYGPASFAFAQGLVKGGAPVTVSQFTALTAGTGTLWLELWGS